jgi:hypothetical protein
MTRESDRSYDAGHDLWKRLQGEGTSNQIGILIAALRRERKDALNEAAKVCRSLADTINATPYVSQFEALLTAAIRIERMESPAAAPATDQDEVAMFGAFGHGEPSEPVAPALDAEAPDPERDRNRHNAMLVEAWREEFGRLCDALFPGHDGMIGWKHVQEKVKALAGGGEGK